MKKEKYWYLDGAVPMAPLKVPVQNYRQKDIRVSHAHLRYLRPFPKNLGDIYKEFRPAVLIPEINNGQLIKIIRDQFLVDAKGYNKIMGVPITRSVK